MRFATLFSGSSGNVTYINHKNTNILIDAGVSARALSHALILQSIYENDISAILLTHDHIDHYRGIDLFAGKFNVPIYALPECAIALAPTFRYLDINNINFIDGDFCVGDLHISPFFTSHDASKSCGFKVCADDGKTIVYATDLGFVSQEILDILLMADGLIIESNYDPYMLSYGNYPPYLKRRIMSKKGHLSNHDCADIVASCAQKKTTRFLLSHLSIENNTRELALDTTTALLAGVGVKISKDITVDIAPRKEPSPLIVL